MWVADRGPAEHCASNHPSRVVGTTKFAVTGPGRVNAHAVAAMSLYPAGGLSKERPRGDS